MRVTVLGRWSPYPPPDGACPGYLVEAAGHRLLVDCGPGVLANLQRVTTVFDLDALVLTHRHYDHLMDVYMVRMALEFGRFPEAAPPLPLYALRDVLDVLPAWEQFAYRPLDEALPIEVGPFMLRFAPTAHSLPCLAARIEAEGKALAYSADTGPSVEVEALAREADLFLCESTLRVQDEPDAPRVGHLSPRLAAQAAARAGVRRLLLTHFWTPFQNLAEEARATAAKEFAHDILIARELETHDV